jgi:hypothetical protein
MSNVQGGNENGARALDEKHGTMRKRARQRHMRKGTEATSKAQRAMSNKSGAEGNW